MANLVNKLRVFILKIIIVVAPKRGYHYINGPETLPAPLNAEEEKATFEMLETDPEKARQTLITHNLRLVVYIAKKFENSGHSVEDLVSIGTIGLIKAVNTFCPNKNIKLATYASRCIENEILMFMRKVSNKKIETSIDEPLNTDWDGNELLFSDVLGTDSDIVSRGVEKEAEHNMIHSVVAKLSERERLIIEMRFGLNGKREMTQKEVADSIGISQSYISRLEKRIIKRLKKDIDRIS